MRSTTISNVLVFMLFGLGGLGFPIDSRSSATAQETGDAAVTEQENAVTEPPSPAGPALRVGSAAPSLNVSQWYKGKPLEAFSPDHVYVIEFWATWCGPCIKAMPHLSELAAQYAKEGLIVVALTTADSANSKEAVEKFIAETGSDYAFRFAFCEQETTQRDFMIAAGQQGIPCSFVIDREGKIAYIGLPGDLDYVLSRVMKGTWKGKADADLLAEMNRSLMSVFEVAMQDTEKALEILELIAKNNPKRTESIEYAYAKVTTLTIAKRYDEAKATTEKYAAQFMKTKNADGLAMLGGILGARQFNPEGIHRDFALATIAKALEIDPEGWQTKMQIAMAYQVMQEKELCAEWLKQAIEGCPDEGLKQVLRENLDRLSQ